jgi:hypothetical protein
MAQVAIRGNTFPVKDQLRALGAKWDADQKCWTITDKKAEDARKIVAAAPPSAPRMPGKCGDCGKACKAPYTLCWDCKGKRDLRAGKCSKCQGPLDQWERNHRMRLCAECRDGGGNAHGGQSYYDRQGNFVLGDND